MSEPLHQIGWWIWNKFSPQHKEFEKKALTDADRKNGYRAIPVYIRTTEYDEDFG